MQVSRRTFVTGAAALSAVAALGLVVVPLPDAAEGYAVLSTGEVATVRALYDAMFPPGNRFGVAGSDVDLSGAVDASFADDLEPAVVPAFRQLLRAIGASPLPTHGRCFADLAHAERVAVLAAWADPSGLPRRLAWEALKVPLAMVWFAQAPVLATIGWRAECGGGTA